MGCLHDRADDPPINKERAGLHTLHRVEVDPAQVGPFGMLIADPGHGEVRLFPIRCRGAEDIGAHDPRALSLVHQFADIRAVRTGKGQEQFVKLLPAAGEGIELLRGRGGMFGHQRTSR